MPYATEQHIGEDLAGNIHRSYGIDEHSAVNLRDVYLVEGLVAGDDAGIVDENVDVAALFYYNSIRIADGFIVAYVYAVPLHFTYLCELLYGGSYVLLVDIPNDYALRAFL